MDEGDSLAEATVPQHRLLVVVDTTEFHQRFELATAGWPELLAWSRYRIIEFGLSEVSLQEAARQYSQSEPARLRQLAAAVDDLDALSLGNFTPRDQLLAAITRHVAEYPSRLRQRLQDANALVFPLPKVSHETLIKRDLGREQPFDSSGKGYRDALIWESLLEHLRSLHEPREVLFVSNDTTDFGGPDKKELAQRLSEEVRATGHVAQLFTSLRDAVEHLRTVLDDRPFEISEPERKRIFALLKERTIEEGYKLIGTAVRTSEESDKFAGEEPLVELELPFEFTGVTIEGVDVNENSIEIEVFERDAEDASYKLQVLVEVLLELDGFVEKGVVEELDDFAIVDNDWNDWYMNVSTEVSLSASWYVEVVRDEVQSFGFDALYPLAEVEGAP